MKKSIVFLLLFVLAVSPFCFPEEEHFWLTTDQTDYSSIAFSAEQERKSIVFTNADGKSLLEIHKDGIFIANGEVLKGAPEVYEKFVAWLNHSCPESRD